MMLRKLCISGILVVLSFLDAQAALGATKGLPEACVVTILKAGGYYKGNIKPAVWRFQGSNKIKPTGKIDEKTERVLMKRAKKYPKACANIVANIVKKQKKDNPAPLNIVPLPDIETGLPDLVVTNFSLNPRFPASGQEVELEVEIRNIGSSTAKNIEYGYSILQSGAIDYQVLMACEDVLALKPNESCVSRTNIRFTASGTGTVILKVDPETKIQESNEDNNSFSMLGVQVRDSSDTSRAVNVFPVQTAVASKSISIGQKNVEFLKFKIANRRDKDIKVLSLNLVLLGNAKPGDINMIHWFDDKKELGTAQFTEYGSGQNFASINSDDPHGCNVPQECKEMFIVESNKEKVITITADISKNVAAPSYAVFAMMEGFYVVLGDKLTVTGTYPVTGDTVLINK